MALVLRCALLDKVVGLVYNIVYLSSGSGL